MKYIRALWYRLLGNTVRNDAQWRAWAIEQAIKAGARPDQVTHYALSYLHGVFGEPGDG